MAEERFYMGRKSRDVVRDIVRRVRQTTHHGNLGMRRRRGKTGGKGGGIGADILIALIDDDIDGVIEDETAVLDDVADVYHDPEGTVVTELSLRSYERRVVNLKYFREAIDGDPGFDEDEKKMVLVTEEVPDDPEEPEGASHIQYSTQEVIFDEGDDFPVGTYGRKVYPDYVGEEWPPLLDGGPGQIEIGKFKRRFRAKCVKDAEGNWVTGTIFCKMLPPPTLESLGYVPEGS